VAGAGVGTIDTRAAGPPGALIPGSGGPSPSGGRSTQRSQIRTQKTITSDRGKRLSSLAESFFRLQLSRSINQSLLPTCPLLFAPNPAVLELKVREGLLVLG
jgi:hypothetical protein